jgi:hypothetical protein
LRGTSRRLFPLPLRMTAHPERSPRRMSSASRAMTSPTRRPARAISCRIAALRRAIQSSPSAAASSRPQLAGGQRPDGRLLRAGAFDPEGAPQGPQEAPEGRQSQVDGGGGELSRALEEGDVIADLQVGEQGRIRCLPEGPAVPGGELLQGRPVALPRPRGEGSEEGFHGLSPIHLSLLENFLRRGFPPLASGGEGAFRAFRRRPRSIVRQFFATRQDQGEGRSGKLGWMLHTQRS